MLLPDKQCISGLSVSKPYRYTDISYPSRVYFHSTKIDVSCEYKPDVAWILYKSSLTHLFLSYRQVFMDIIVVARRGAYTGLKYISPIAENMLLMQSGYLTCCSYEIRLKKIET